MMSRVFFFGPGGTSSHNLFIGRGIICGEYRLGGKRFNSCRALTDDDRRPWCVV